MDLYTVVFEIDKIVAEAHHDSQPLRKIIENELKTSNAINNKYISKLERIIGGFVSQLSDKDILHIWEQTDMGLISKEEGGDFGISAESAKYDVEMEILSEYTKFLWNKYADTAKGKPPAYADINAESYADMYREEDIEDMDEVFDEFQDGYDEDDQW